MDAVYILTAVCEPSPAVSFGMGAASRLGRRVLPMPARLSCPLSWNLRPCVSVWGLAVSAQRLGPGPLWGSSGCQELTAGVLTVTLLGRVRSCCFWPWALTT